MLWEGSHGLKYDNRKRSIAKRTNPTPPSIKKGKTIKIFDFNFV
jgi:hypothetical protein